MAEENNNVNTANTTDTTTAAGTNTPSAQPGVKVTIGRKKRKNHTFLKFLLAIVIIALVIFLTLWITTIVAKDTNGNPQFDSIKALVDYIIANVKK
jgi:hypothetical protein